MKYGSKAELWKRLETAERTQLQEQQKHPARQRRLCEGTTKTVAANTPQGPDEPTSEERATHELTHLPASWCEHCIKGRAVDVAHTAGAPGAASSEAAGWRSTTQLHLPVGRRVHCQPARCTRASPWPAWAPFDVLTQRYDVESKYNLLLGPGHNLWPWLVRWESFVKSRYKIKSGWTAYQDAFDTDYSRDILPFGETAMFRTASRMGAMQGRKRVLKGDSLWRQGIFLGRTLQSAEYLFGPADGVYTARRHGPYYDDYLERWTRRCDRWEPSPANREKARS